MRSHIKATILTKFFFKYVNLIKKCLWAYTEKSYQYNFCDKALQLNYYLKKHLDTHWRESYKCQMCDKELKFNSYRSSHLKTHHVPYLEMLLVIFQTKSKQNLNKFFINPLIKS